MPIREHEALISHIQALKVARLIRTEIELEDIRGSGFQNVRYYSISDLGKNIMGALDIGT